MSWLDEVAGWGEPDYAADLHSAIYGTPWLPQPDFDALAKPAASIIPRLPQLEILPGALNIFQSPVAVPVVMDELPPSWKLPNRPSGATPMDGAFDYGNWQAGQPLGGYAGVPGTYSVDTSAAELLRQVGSPEARTAFELSLASQSLFTPLNIRPFSLPPLTIPGTQRATQQQLAPAANWNAWLIYGAAFLALVLLVRR